MAVQRTFSIIKPDATRRNLTGAINAKLEAAGLRVVAQKRIHLSLAQAQTFYGVHKDRPFFGELTEFMSSAPIVAQVLEGEDAIAKNREVMGATNPTEAAEGTIRVAPAAQLGQGLRLEQFDHVVDQAVQFLGWPPVGRHHRGRRVQHLHLQSLRTTSAVGDAELDLLTGLQGCHTGRQRGRPHMHVVTAAVLGDEPKTLVSVVPLDLAAGHPTHLS